MRVLVGALIVSVIAIAGAFVLAHRPAIGAIARPDPASFARDDVVAGERLARIGDCAVCHDATGGKPYAGGLALATPFGALYSSNITPDERTGIGAWSREAFRRAMREGVSRDGHHLYPALPYEHFTRVSDEDLDRVYAFLMTRPAVAATPPPNRLVPPLGFRPLLAGWKLLFLRRGVWRPTAGRSAEWNRGAYLADGLGHCGACHTPRNILGAETGDAYAGGWADGWVSPPLNGLSPARRAWSVDRLVAYLRTGLDSNHAAAAGPMGPVTGNLARAPDADVRAIAVYTAALMANAPAARTPDAPPLDNADEALRLQPVGAALFAGACAQCHDAGAPMSEHGRPSLSLGSPLWEDDPRDAIQIVLQGLHPPVGKDGPAMPAYAALFDDAQVAALTAYIRARYSDLPVWRSLPRAVAQARTQGAKP